MPLDPRTGVNYALLGSGHPLMIGLPLMASHTDIFGAAGAAVLNGYLDRLTDRYQVLLVDYPSIGGSRDIAPRDLTVERVCADLLGVADAAGFDRFAYWGYSWSGAVGLQLAARTDRLSALVVGGWPPLGAPYAGILEATRRKQAAPEASSLVVLRNPAQYAQWESYYASMGDWDEAVSVSAIACPKLVMFGSDGDLVEAGVPVAIASAIRAHRGELESQGWEVVEIAGHGHGVTLLPELVVPPVRRFLTRIFEPMNPPPTELDPAAAALLAPWSGPFGGLPPLDRLTPVALEAAFRAALEMKRSEVRAIAASAESPSFANTVEALEDCGRALGRVQPLLTVMSSGHATGEMPAVAQRLAPLLPQLDDEIAHDEQLFARIDAVWRERDAAGLTAEQRRLVAVVHGRMQRQGAALRGGAKARLEAVNARLAELSAAYQQNLIADGERGVVFVDDERGLDGLAEPLRRAAAATAAARGRPGAWAIANERAAVWAFLTHATRRDLREQVWRMWTDRGDHAGAHDNKPLMAEMLLLRGEKAGLLGYPSYAHYAMADRMVSDPQRALQLLEDTWASVIGAARGQIADYQAIADRDGSGIPIAPWDRQFYAEKMRRERFGLDGDLVKAHLPLDAVLAAMFWAAGRAHGLAFAHIADAPLSHPSCRAYEVSRGGESVGVLYFDLLNRPGKMHGSYQYEYRAHETFRGKVLPIASINSSFPTPAEGEPVLLPWEYANVFFHEFGHALHMLSSRVAYPSLGSVKVAWDFVELPALINERWLIHGDVLSRFASHHLTGEPMPAGMIERIEQGLRYDRIFSLNLDYLLPAIVDLRMHLRSDGSGAPIDAVQIERDTMAELGMPEAWDLVMRVTHSFHSFVGAYAAGVYVYLWADIMAADATETFLAARGGLYDAEVTRSWRDTVLSVGHGVPADQAFRDFTGHDPRPQPLQRRFDLVETPA